MFRRYLSDDELSALMRVICDAHHPRDHALYALLANSGIRPSEALSLKRGDLHLEDSAPWFRVYRMKKKKATPEFDDLQLTKGVASLLRTHMSDVDADPNAHVFEMSRRAASRAFHHYAATANITGKVTLYMLRHTAATRMYRHTRDIYLVQSLLGHEKPDVTAIYAHIPASVMAEMSTRVPAII